MRFSPVCHHQFKPLSEHSGASEMLAERFIHYSHVTSRGCHTTLGDPKSTLLDDPRPALAAGTDAIVGRSNDRTVFPLMN